MAAVQLLTILTTENRANKKSYRRKKGLVVAGMALDSREQELLAGAVQIGGDRKDSRVTLAVVARRRWRVGGDHQR